MNTTFRLFFLLVFVALIFFIVFNQKETSLYTPLSYSEPAFLREVPMFLAIADSDEERQEGLSGQQSLESNQGLLFVFSTADRHGI